MSKYRNKRVTVDGITFDSIKEARRYMELKMLEKGGYISDLQLQVPFELVPTQRNRDGKVVSRKVSYIADFTYTEDGQFVVEDVKGFQTDLYRLKKALMMDRHGIEIREV